MKWLVVFAAVSVVSPTGAAHAQVSPAPQRSQQPASSPDKTAEAYAQFMIGHRLAENDDEAGAIAAYKRAMELDPLASDIPAELAGLITRFIDESRFVESIPTTRT